MRRKRTLIRFWRWTAVCAALFVIALSGCAKNDSNTELALAVSAETIAPEIVLELGEVADTPVPTALPAPSPIPTAMASATPISTPTPTPGPSKETFMLVWTSDTQHYSELHPEYLTAMTQWVRDHQTESNIKAFIHTGDMVNRAASTRQWGNIDAALDLLGSDIPFLALAGNHDVGTDSIDYRYFLNHVASRYPYVSDFYQKGRGAYIELPMEPVDFLLIGTGWGYKDAAVNWLNKTIAKYSKHVVILVAHSYLNTNGSLTDGGEILFEKVVKRNPNVRLVLSGHRDDIAFRKDDVDDSGDGVPDRTVYTQLYNYQEVQQNGGGGYMRLLMIDPVNRTMRVSTYSPYFNDWKTGEAEQFTVENLF